MLISHLSKSPLFAVTHQQQQQRPVCSRPSALSTLVGCPIVSSLSRLPWSGVRYSLRLWDARANLQGRDEACSSASACKVTLGGGPPLVCRLPLPYLEWLCEQLDLLLQQLLLLVGPQASTLSASLVHALVAARHPPWATSSGRSGGGSMSLEQLVESWEEADAFWREQCGARTALARTPVMTAREKQSPPLPLQGGVQPTLYHTSTISSPNDALSLLSAYPWVMATADSRALFRSWAAVYTQQYEQQGDKCMLLLQLANSLMCRFAECGIEQQIKDIVEAFKEAVHLASVALSDSSSSASGWQKLLPRVLSYSCKEHLLLEFSTLRFLKQYVEGNFNGRASGGSTVHLASLFSSLIDPKQHQEEEETELLQQIISSLEALHTILSEIQLPLSLFVEASNPKSPSLKVGLLQQQLPPAAHELKEGPLSLLLRCCDFAWTGLPVPSRESFVATEAAADVLKRGNMQLLSEKALIQQTCDIFNAQQQQQQQPFSPATLATVTGHLQRVTLRLLLDWVREAENGGPALQYLDAAMDSEVLLPFLEGFGSDGESSSEEAELVEAAKLIADTEAPHPTMLPSASAEFVKL
ncbi:hypothetical protein cyc_03605 [Cyclospora cayetanensis]|uniref:Uncharacterized protein n=1 Tax=Cyclospora cayetanensis TaxID=88456 RepID=A0A1D3CSY0_9EIME|nr:hypothetical protein cyc_03605 [Cyclospora cayetanensis]